MARPWSGAGPEFRLDWGGRAWTLRVDGERPGMVDGGASGTWLGLDGLAAAGRNGRGVLSGASLTGVERRGDRVEATYAPPGWGELVVRAAWAPSGEEGVDLEIQVGARSVGDLRRLEVLVASGPPADEPAARWVEPRDARAAASSYDGRERDLDGLTTLPIRAEALRRPRLVAGLGDGLDYLEMAHPDDLARRVLIGGATPDRAPAALYGLFGHDLERGVLLRGRLRALWLASGAEVQQQFDRFLAGPLPLGT